MKISIETTHCDMCGAKLKSSKLNSEFVKSLREGGFWKRIHVRIAVRSGVNNSAEDVPAELCATCATRVLELALMGVRNGVDGNNNPIDDAGVSTAKSIFHDYHYDPKEDACP